MAKPSKELDYSWFIHSGWMTALVLLAVVLADPLTEIGKGIGEFGKGLQAAAQILARAEGWVCW